MGFLSKIAKMKNRRLLILSAGGPQGAIQGIYINVEGSLWSIISHSLIPYPESVKKILDDIMLGPKNPVSLETLGRLDKTVSDLFLECAGTLCASVSSKVLRRPHAIVLNKLELWKECDTEKSRCWNMEIGEARMIAARFGVPVATDFAKNGILCGNSGILPLSEGIKRIFVDDDGIAAHISIGLISHVFIYDSRADHTIFDTDAGPGTCLVNLVIKESSGADGFDRDGSLASQGKVNTQALETMASDPVFSSPIPRRFRPIDIAEMAHQGCLADLAINDRIATLTALTARTAFDLYRKEYHHVVSPKVILVSGGGANNLALLEYLKTYFAPIPIKRIDDIGIPSEMFVPMALGLSVDSFITKNHGKNIQNKSPENPDIATWIFP
jgi:anhydro-N-acetylmuramic acid kinase